MHARKSKHTYLQQRRERVVAQRLWKAGPKRLARTRFMSAKLAQTRRCLISIPDVVAQAQVAPHDVLEETHCLCLDKLIHHVAEHSADGVKTFVCVAYVREARLVEEDLLHNEDRDCLGELGSSLHDTQAKGDDFRREQEMNDRVIVILLARSQSCPGA